MRDGTWKGFEATFFEVNQKDWRPIWERKKKGGKLVMRVHKGDVIAIEDGDRTRFMSVHQLKPKNNKMVLAEHFEGGQLQPRHEDGRDLFEWKFVSISKLKSLKARLVHVDILGKVHAKKTNID